MCAVLLSPGVIQVAFKYIHIISYHHIISYIKSRIMRWAVHAARIGKRRGVYRVLVENLRERDHLEHPGLDERIIFRQIFRKWDVEAWTGSIWFIIGTGDGHL
jgi:hypothetical protein